MGDGFMYLFVPNEVGVVQSNDESTTFIWNWLKILLQLQ